MVFLPHHHPFSSFLSFSHSIATVLRTLYDHDHTKALYILFRQTRLHIHHLHPYAHFHNALEDGKRKLEDARADLLSFLNFPLFPLLSFFPLPVFHLLAKENCP
jgi:hypothetical protein